jgi:uncharacterized protein (TIRG00374 family)
MNFNKKYVILLAVSIFLAATLLGYVFSIVDFDAILIEFKKAKLEWVYLSIVVSVFANIARGLRWNLLLEPMQLRIRPINAVFAVLTGYLANFAFPRIGELARCSYVNRTDNIPINNGLGTVITERIVDVIFTLFIIVLGFLVEFQKLVDFINSIINLENIFSKAINIGILLASLAIFISFFIFFLKKYKGQILRIGIVSKLIGFLQGILHGILSILKIKKVGLFVFYSLAIWFGYFLMVYVLLFAFEETAVLPAKVALIILCLGSLAMIAPVQGGIGAYHIMVMSALMIYGIEQEKALIVATIMHSSQFIAVLLFGSISLIGLLQKKPNLDTK